MGKMWTNKHLINDAEAINSAYEQEKKMKTVELSHTIRKNKTQMDHKYLDAKIKL